MRLETGQCLWNHGQFSQNSGWCGPLWYNCFSPQKLPILRKYSNTLTNLILFMIKTFLIRKATHCLVPTLFANHTLFWHAPPAATHAQSPSCYHARCRDVYISFKYPKNKMKTFKEIKILSTTNFHDYCWPKAFYNFF